MRVQVPGIGKSLDAVTREAFAALKCEPWGGISETGWSKQGTFQRCPRRYQLLYELGAAPLVVNVSQGLDVGNVMHSLLAAHYAKMLPDDRYPGWRPNCPEPAALLDAFRAAGLDPETSSLCDQLFSGYLERWANETIIPVAVEMPIGDAKFHTSRADMIFHEPEGLHTGLWIGEHKNLAASTDIDVYRLDGEVLGLILSAYLSNLHEFFGQEILGVCLNVVFKPTKTGLPRYQRMWITPPWEAIQRYAEDRKFWIRSMLECKPMKIWPKALNGCTTKYRKCRFFDHCRDLDDTQLVFPTVVEEPNG